MPLQTRNTANLAAKTDRKSLSVVYQISDILETVKAEISNKPPQLFLPTRHF